jgi:hypothetical protein
MSPSDRILDPKTGIVVPGGVITIDPYRKKLFFWLRALTFSLFDYYAASNLKRDIVIQDPTREHELFREGPYDGITVSRPLERILTEIGQFGLEGFLTRRRDDSSKSGPISITKVTSNQVYERAALFGVD